MVEIGIAAVGAVIIMILAVRIVYVSVHHSIKREVKREEKKGIKKENG